MPNSATCQMSLTPQPQRLPSSPGPFAAATNGKVMVVDDDPELREAMKTTLGRKGYQVVLARDGEEALLTACLTCPDVVLLDISMPGPDGYEVCRQIKGHVATRLIPVVFVTGLSDRQARLDGLDAGADDFVTKPFDGAELEARVRNLVALRQVTRDLDSAEKIVFAVARAVEARDPGTGAHCERLAEVAVRLGSRLGLLGRDLTTLRRAGYLHDIGKIGIPDAILLKQGDLNADEWVVMRRHPDIGFDICAPLRSLRSVLPIIRHHHEHLDGSGYPDGLAGDSVPPLARVFQVADVFDALVTDRPYRRAMSPRAALEVLSEEAGLGFWDPEVVQAMDAIAGDIFGLFSSSTVSQGGGRRCEFSSPTTTA